TRCYRDWSSDGCSSDLGRREGKALAVFIARGPSGWGKVALGGKLPPAALRLLAERYVCVYVDADQPAGRRLAGAFGMKDGPGLRSEERRVGKECGGQRT